jgi:hypothetical protein
MEFLPDELTNRKIAAIHHSQRLEHEKAFALECKTVPAQVVPPSTPVCVVEKAKKHWFSKPNALKVSPQIKSRRDTVCCLWNQGIELGLLMHTHCRPSL